MEEQLPLRAKDAEDCIASTLLSAKTHTIVKDGKSLYSTPTVLPRPYVVRNAIW